MRNSFYISFLIVLLILTYSPLYAVPAYPFPQQILQPDGTSLSVILKGDEFHHYHVTEDGYFIKRGINGVFNYAIPDEYGRLQDTKIKANDPNKRESAEKSFVSALQVNQSLQRINKEARVERTPSSTNAGQKSQFPRVGSPKSLVILVNFKDTSFVTPNPKMAFSALLNEKGYSANGGTGSARDYFIDNSSGKFSPEFDVVGPFTLPQRMSFYGENGTNDSDKNPVQMIVDACKAADDAGVDFSVYDTENDGIVDNVFVYYAGYNEAEWGGVNTIWPHRWGIYPTSIYNGGNYGGSAASVTFDGKRVEDYACTSELRGKTGTNMAGIGTFTHEFGHVIGLADMYATNGAKHHTLSYWDIMDAGAYLNQGRTPPAYNTFERMQLGFITPYILTGPEDVKLQPLTTHNQAYLISPSDVHNLNGNNPSPVEYFLLENRQKVGWDAYLPGHGMLIYRIYYNQNDWYYNQPNNDPLKMGVDIIEADKTANTTSFAGDPFPGTSNVDSYIPALRSGTELNKPITSIIESDKTIIFRYKGGKNVPVLSAESNFTPASTVQGTPSESQSITVAGIRLVSDMIISFVQNEHFEVKKETDPESAWAKSLKLTPVDSVVTPIKILVRYNPTVPSYRIMHSDMMNITSVYAATISKNVTGKSTRPVYVVEPTATKESDLTYKGFVANWNPVFDATGYYLTVIETNAAGEQSPMFTDKWVETTSYTLYHLISGRNYFYKVKASDKNLQFEYENITGYSNTVQVKTPDYPYEKELRAVVSKGSVKVFVPSDDKSAGEPGAIKTVDILNTMGQKVKSYPADRDIVEISDLPRGMVFIIQSGKYRTKVIL